MRQEIEVAMRTTAFSGSFDSAAATVVISGPTIEKNTVVTAAITGVQPLGAKPPPWAVRFDQVGPCGEVKPNAYAAATAMNATIAATLIDENQNSNSPYERAESRFTAVMMAMSASPICQTGRSNQRCRICAPAMASIGTTTIQKYQ